MRLDGEERAMATGAPGAARMLALYGTAAPPAPARVLCAGALSAELVGGRVRHVRFAGREVVREIAFLARGEFWRTLPAELGPVDVARIPGGWRAGFQARVETDGASFIYRAEIELTAHRLRFAAAGSAGADLRLNRLGFVVLHPVEGVAGETVTVEHSDGTREATAFPGVVSPAQPMFDIRALAQTLAPGVTLSCRMTGDAYEMEDQRNWTDASFKTYIRPLARPRPFVLPAGEAVRQEVEIEVSAADARPPAPPEPSGPVAIRLGPGAGRMPDFGTGVSAQALPGAAALARLPALAPGHLLCTFRLADDDPAALGAFAALAASVPGARMVLEAVVPGSDPAAELGLLAARTRAAGLRPAALSVFLEPYLRSHQPAGPWPRTPPFAAFYDAARAAFPGVPAGGGMFTHFTELNRRRDAAIGADHVSHTTCPIVHDADDVTVMESLEALAWVFMTLRSFAPDRPYRVGPVAIALRHHPGGARPLANERQQRVPIAGNDPRQRGLFAAAWTVGYAAEAARAGLAAVTFAEAAGPRGVIHERGPIAAPLFDPLGDGALYPIWHALAALAAGSGRPLRAARSAAPARVRGLAWQEAGGDTALLLANLTAEPQAVRLEGPATGTARVLAAADVTAAALDPGFLARDGVRLAGGLLTLDAFAVARVRLDDRET